MNGRLIDSRRRLRALLGRWSASEWLRPLDVAFADFLWREVPEAPPLLLLGAALASHQLGRGHVCLDLAATLAEPERVLALPPEAADSAPPGGRLPVPAEVLAGLSLAEWLAALDRPALVARGAGNTPLVLAGGRLYLRRYWQCEQDVRRAIAQRLGATAAPAVALRAALDGLFPAPAAGLPGPDWQKVACALAARNAFAIITGGPGTGKTTTVVRLLALLQELALGGSAADQQTGALRIRLAAPTGKAAARLNEAIAGALARLPLGGLAQGEALRGLIPATATTVHRLLGSRPETRRFRHHSGHPLAVDVLVIDEASMVDLELMAAVFAALPPAARLVLLGDKDQLASVEAGAVLGELCRGAAEAHYLPETAEWIGAATGQPIGPEWVDPQGQALDQTIVMLRRSHRFAAESGIGQLAEAVNDGDPERVVAILEGRHADLAFVLPTAGEQTALDRLAVDGCAGERPGAAATPQRQGYRHYLETMHRRQPAPDAGKAEVDGWANEVLSAYATFQVLSALRRGPWGVERLNRQIARVLCAASLIPESDGWHPGRPVLVTRNDYGLGLMNGDIGITLAIPAGPDRGTLRVAFASGDAGRPVRWVAPVRLQAVETAYALTVHKAQGSEFGHVALVLPETANPVLTRELLYTGITRARSFLSVVSAGGLQLVRDTVARRVLRASGLSGEAVLPSDRSSG
ncbi:exodeoxyribonuclease V subunit alpha [Accumulibacter sp.]|uniref:exodeoxyribonuclease V subunit alpha n=1 Tax=Accumulibacter sp. TaxID=2053492 RepID=UPI0025E96926|nr:exodeoxyribonuclease V subunit alpha [Accumulibacter sp.]MCM8596320.1 exodeoxyribonuclease V subunit alpha [Accumulibacter sp.]MCM8627454.1 exodeoxyribonuclease V subunit alpha [Accumulibacter sp.]MDS4050469.1 exodeoxyribonuclease V subunit alpha [Accumulibacter sp.]